MMGLGALAVTAIIGLVFLPIYMQNYNSDRKEPQKIEKREEPKILRNNIEKTTLQTTEKNVKN
jgi:hypothetical protein